MVTCGPFVAEMGKGPAADLMLGVTVMSWLEGYLTAYNETLAKSPEIGGDLSKGLTEIDVLDWLVDYCSAHPNELMASAAREVIIYLFRLASNRASAVGE